MKNKLLTILLVFSMVLLSSTDIHASGNEQLLTTEQKLLDENYREIVKEKHNVEELSKQYNVDPEKLTDEIIKGADSDRYSPFSNLEIVGEETVEEETVNNLARSEHIVENQDSTLYLSTGDPGASGNMPYIGSCAVHRVSSTDKSPLIPFGTTVTYLNRTVTIGGKAYSSFVVNDTGDKSFNRSLYWTDIYYGDNTEANQYICDQYGVKHDVTLYWIR